MQPTRILPKYFPRLKIYFHRLTYIYAHSQRQIGVKGEDPWAF